MSTKPGIRYMPVASISWSACGRAIRAQRQPRRAGAADRRDAVARDDDVHRALRRRAGAVDQHDAANHERLERPLALVGAPIRRRIQPPISPAGWPCRPRRCAGAGAWPPWDAWMATAEAVVAAHATATSSARVLDMRAPWSVAMLTQGDRRQEVGDRRQEAGEQDAEGAHGHDWVVPDLTLGLAPASNRQRLRPERGAKSPRESARGVGPRAH